jgi:hypothetical protein
MDTDNMEHSHLTDQDTRTVSSDLTHPDGRRRKNKKTDNNKKCTNAAAGAGDLPNNFTK